MKVLVTAATKHGATDEIAQAIGRALTAARADAAVIPPDEVTTLVGYDAVVLGSAVYMGRWLDPAKRFVERHRAALVERPVWLFSSGPIGDPLKPNEEPIDAAPLRESLGARDHRVFGGRLEKRGLGLAEKAVAAALRVPEGDYRPWTEIDAWAATIARSLGAEPVPDPVGVG